MVCPVCHGYCLGITHDGPGVVERTVCMSTEAYSLWRMDTIAHTLKSPRLLVGFCVQGADYIPIVTGHD